MSERCQWADDMDRDPDIEPCWGPIETEYDDVMIDGDDGPEWETYEYECCRGHVWCALFGEPYAPGPTGPAVCHKHDDCRACPALGAACANESGEGERR